MFTWIKGVVDFFAKYNASIFDVPEMFGFDVAMNVLAWIFGEK